MRPEYYIDVAVALAELVRNGLLLRHAAADHDLLIGICLFCVRESADVAVNALLCVLADGAGVHNDDVSLAFIGGELIAHLAEHTANFLTVSLVLLAAVGIDHRLRRGGQGGVYLRHLLHYFTLVSELGVRNYGSHVKIPLLIKSHHIFYQISVDFTI